LYQAEQQSGPDFDQEHTLGDWRTAGAAATSEDDETEDRNKI
jgi:hypothetical protein